MEGYRLRAAIGALALVALAGVVVLDRSSAMGPSELVVYADPNYISWLRTLEESDGGKVGEFTSSLSPMNGYELPLNMYYADARGLANCPTCGDFAKAGMNPDGTWKSDPSVPVAVEEEPLVAVKKPCGACSGAGGPYEVPLIGASPLAQESVERIFAGVGECECDDDDD